ncbi:Odorant receptor 123 [Nylanderia fulva]|uniref:Odorant receptor n=1 Tax=Nylanderia fulva TaxID=613905 RepID=A0A6G1LPL6_9HYME|nr:Odorant receptor 123 [Nylanderia fulva]
MDNVDQFFKNSLFNVVRSLLSIGGLWPFHTLKRRCAIYFVIILILGSGFMFELLGTVDILHDTFELIDSVPVFLFAVVNMFKLCYGIYTLPKIKLLLINMREYYLSSKSDEEVKIYNSHALYARNFGFIYSCNHPVMFQVMTLVAKLNSKESKENFTSSDTEYAAVKSGLAHPVNYMVDVDTYYVPIFIHTVVCEVGYTFLLVTFDVLYVTLIEHCCGLLEGLRYRLENAVNIEENDDLMFIQDKSYLNLVYSIQRYTETMQFVTIMESVFSLPLFVHIGCFIICLSTVGFQVITHTGNVHHLLKYYSYLNGLLINIFFENWQGQKIIDSSEKVFNSAYNAEWYNMSNTTKKLLIMILMISKKPLIFTIGKLFSLSYITFNSVMRTSMSYFMLLRSVQ